MILVNGATLISSIVFYGFNHLFEFFWFCDRTLNRQCVAFAVLFGLMLLLIEPKTGDAALPRLYARLPVTGTARVSRLSVNDHYTEAYTTDGSCH